MRLHTVLVGVATVAAALTSTQVAQARPWTASYDWQGQASTGYEHWTVHEQLPQTGVPGPWYEAALGGASQGRGLVLRPLGGRLYDNGDPSSQLGGPGTIVRWQAPGASTITRATFSTLRYRNEDDDQYLRARVYGGPGVDEREDFGPAYGQANPATTYSLPTTTLTPSAPGTAVEAWLFTVCHPNPPGSGAYACPNIPTDSDTFGRVGRVEIALDDPDDPTAEVASDPPIGDGWTNKRRPQKLTITANDPSSGIARIRTQLRLGSSTRTLADTNISCDERHRTDGRGGLVCPATATSRATDRATDSSTKDRTYLITVWDHAGNQTTRSLVLRRDVAKPTTGSIGGQLAKIARKWTNRSDTIPVTVRARDGQSGVGRVTLAAQRVGSGRTIDLGTAEPPCDHGCKSISTTVPVDLAKLDRDGRYRLKLRVADRAGNTRTFTVGPTLKIDRTAPRPSGPAPTYTIGKDGTVRVVFTPSRDPQPGSGRIRLYMVRYYPRPSGSSRTARPRFAHIIPARTRAATSAERKLRKSRSRALAFRAPSGIDTDRPVTLIELDDTEGKITTQDTDDEDGVPLGRSATLRLRGGGGAARGAVIGAELGSAGGPWGAAAGGLVGALVGLYTDKQIDKWLFPEDAPRPERCDSDACFDVYRYEHNTALPRLRAATTAIRKFRRAPTSPRLLGRALGKFGTARSAVLRVKRRAISQERAKGQPERITLAWREVHRNMILWNRSLVRARRLLISEHEQAVRRRTHKDLQPVRARAARTARRIARRAAVGRRTCRDSRGPGGWIVYYGRAVPGGAFPDGSPIVNYVGITRRSMKTRCDEHRTRKTGGNLFPNYATFGRLPPLPSELAAQEVEQVLMEHWGIARANSRRNLDTGTIPDRLSILRNLRLNFSGRKKKGETVAEARLRYCAHVIRGAAVLRAVGYPAFATRYFPRRNCP